MATLRLSQDPEADALLGHDPLASHVAAGTVAVAPYGRTL